MSKDEFINDPAIRLAVQAHRAAIEERSSARRSRIEIGQRKWIMLLVLVVVIVLIGALVLSHIDTREFFRLDLGLVSEHWS